MCVVYVVCAHVHCLQASDMYIYMSHRPLTLDSMKSVEGVSDFWLEKYGRKFLEAIANYCQAGDVDVPMDVHMSGATQSLPKQTTIKVCVSILLPPLCLSSSLSPVPP